MNHFPFQSDFIDVPDEYQLQLEILYLVCLVCIAILLPPLFEILDKLFSHFYNNQSIFMLKLVKRLCIK